MTNNGGNTQHILHKRLKLLQNDFYINPMKTIQSFLGSDTNIIKYTVNNIYIDGYVIVDVDYTNLELDLLKIYWVQFKDCKLLNIKKSNAYICNIDGFNVCVIINKQYDDNKWLALNIKPTIQTQRGDVFYKYYGMILDTPFHAASTEIFNYNHQPITTNLSKCNVDTELFPDDVVNKAYNDINNMFTYKSTLQALTTQELIKIQSLDEGTDKNKLYLIDIRNITNPEQYKGFLACSQYRNNPWEVLYIRIPNYVLSSTKVDYLKWFMLNDYNNYLQWIEKLE